jgi:hypothetical protein
MKSVLFLSHRIKESSFPSFHYVFAVDSESRLQGV